MAKGKITQDYWWALCVLGLIVTFLPNALWHPVGFLICGISIYFGHPTVQKWRKESQGK